EPLHDALLAHDSVVANDPVHWPIGARRRLKASISRLEKLMAFCHKLSKSHPHLTTGVVGAVIVQLLAEDLPEFNADEQIVLDAIRRLNSRLTEASVEELATYVQSLDGAQLRGFRNNVLGIAHELRFMERMNNNGDHYVVELLRRPIIPALMSES